jgi:hypothetical protein
LDGSSWRADFIDELLSFPSGRHDDQVDAFVHALAYLRGAVRPGAFRFVAVGRANDDRWRGY